MRARAVMAGLVACVAGGLLASVAVAWAVSIAEGWSPQTGGGVAGKASRGGVTYYVWKVVGPASELWEARELRELTGGSPSGEKEQMVLPGWAEAEPGRVIVSRGFGWPVVCLRGVEAEITPSATVGGRVRPARGWIVLRKAQRGSPLVRVPILPVWGGLAVNSMVMGVPVLLIAIGARSVVRRRRRERGACEGCGYPLGGLGELPCPECGTASGRIARTAVDSGSE